MSVRSSRTVEGLRSIRGIVPIPLHKRIREWFGSDDVQEQLYSVGKGKNSRKVLQYGYSYTYGRKTTITEIDDIPDILCELRELIDPYVDFDVSVLNQCIINRYEPGQGISSHIDDTRFGETIVCFTLISGRCMEFNRDDEKYEIYTAPRSVYIMEKDARYEWTHQMRSRLSDTVDGEKVMRKACISVTFRMVSE